MIDTKAGQEKKDLKTERLEVRGKTLVFDNSIYQVSNIAAVEVGTLQKPLSPFFWVSLAAVGAGILFEVVWLALLGILGGSIFYGIHENKEYGLILRLNSGLSQLIVSGNLSFLKEVAVVLRRVMDSEEGGSLTFNLDQRTIVDNVTGSSVVMGDMTGDLVNRID